MKKFIGLGILTFTLIIGVACSGGGTTNTSITSSQESSVNNIFENYTYSADSFEELPEDWSLYSLSDVDHTTTTFSDGNINISHNNPNISNKMYYGSVYQIGIDKEWTDFSFEIEFKSNSYDNTSRFLAVMYRTSYFGNNLMGYVMNYRHAGESASSVADFNGIFTDDTKVTGLPKLTDGNFHTIRIDMEGTLAKHYIDDQLITEHDTTTKEEKLGKISDEGGFALVVNRSAISVKSVEITGTMKKVNPYAIDANLVDTYVQENSIINPATVVNNVTSKEILDKMLVEEKRPSNAILTIDKNMNVIDAKNKVISSFDDVYEALDKKIIPVVYISGEEEADAFLEYHDNQRSILDMAVMSKDSSILAKVKNEKSSIRAILDVEEVSDLYEIVKQAQIGQAITVAIPQDDALVEDVAYLQGMFKTVWVKLNSSSEQDIYNSFASGAYGLICDDPVKVYNTFESMGEISSRTPFNVAHRGVMNLYNENSISGLQAAADNGATHVELDVMVTTDNELVLMHDDTIDRTTNGSGSTENMTYAQLSQYLIDEINYEIIPTLDEVAEILIETDLIFVLEIKTDKRRCVEVLKDKIDSSETYQKLLRQMVVIAFDNSQLSNMKELLPQIPTASLNNASADNFVTVLEWMGLYNTGIDTPNGYGTKEFNEQYLRDRGIIGWYWTYANETAINNAYDLGIVGVTNNAPTSFAEKIKYVRGINSRTKNEVKIGDTVMVQIETYNETYYDANAIVVSVEETDDAYLVVAKYTDSNENNSNESFSYLTQSFKIRKDFENVKPSNDYTPIIIGTICGSVVLVGIILSIILLKKKKNNTKN